MLELNSCNHRGGSRGRLFHLDIHPEYMLVLGLRYIEIEQLVHFE